ncbi:proteoglycan 4-like [Hyposmocoma kahamanoa]|uniref:proteoglycan 4-like n=1 Tax=Hyposmocoma kahamanoa TaxID=1477025 RepID=UPI000E6D723E|nr:proteoglycan 4-like [Hyposmocoma kahamanoa]
MPDVRHQRLSRILRYGKKTGRDLQRPKLGKKDHLRQHEETTITPKNPTGGTSENPTEGTPKGPTERTPKHPTEKTPENPTKANTEKPTTEASTNSVTNKQTEPPAETTTETPNVVNEKTTTVKDTNEKIARTSMAKTNVQYPLPRVQNHMSNYHTYQKRDIVDECPRNQVRLGNICIWVPPRYLRTRIDKQQKTLRKHLIVIVQE